MSFELSPANPPAPKVQSARNLGERQHLLRRAIPTISFRAILALSIGGLLVNWCLSGKALTHSATETAPPQTISSLEALVRTSPTAANRINLSLAYINDNQPGRAIPVLNSIIGEDEKNALAWNNLCVANTMLSAYKTAIEDCTRALQIAPDFQLARNNLKWVEDENRKAIVAITAQEQVAPARRDAASYMAEGLDDLHIGNYDQAIKAWQRTLDLDPKNALAANNIGTAYMLSKQSATAKSWFVKALALDPSLQIAKNNMAWAIDEETKPVK